MVDAVVSFVVQRLGDYLIQEASLFSGARDEVKWLKNKLEWMQCFLKDAEEKQDNGDNRVRKWISEVREIAYDAEDIIDDSLLKRTSITVGIMVSKYSLAREIKALKIRVLEISRDQETFGIKSIGDGRENASGMNERLKRLRRASFYADDEHVVGFKEDAEVLLNELLKEEPHRCVISVLGMGGLGKTTLARKLYNCNAIKHKFDCYAWICVSQEYRIQDLLQRIIKSFKRPTKEELEMIEKMTEEELEEYLREFLEERRYVVVIDDVWHREAYESLRRAFPDKRNGSRVIITTRIKTVAQRADERTFIHELRFLRPDESWELFCRKAFPNSGTCCPPPGLEMLGREMVAKCGGLPLAIIVLGGLLSVKKPHEWQTIREHLWRHLRNDSIQIMHILTLSFNDLSYQLKSCFLYLGIFPEDFVIDAEKLIQLWVAEGFIPQGEETMEETAWECLNELIDRSLIQVAKRSWDRIDACRLHDLLRDLAVQRAKEISFLNICISNINSSLSSTSSSCRRYAIHPGGERYVTIDQLNPRVRSLLFFKPYGEPLKWNGFKLIYTRFRLLRVLHLDCSFSENSFTRAIEKLVNLRYLRLSKSFIERYPPSIGNLGFLQTFIALGDQSFSLPTEICNLKQLRHLVGYMTGNLEVSKLTNLQTLKYIDFSQWIRIDPSKLINLRNLDVKRITGSGGQFILDSIGKLESLRSLSLTAQIQFPPLQPLSHCRHLLELKLEGQILSLPPTMHEFFPILKYLVLIRSELQHDPMKTLENLPNLMILDLQYWTYRGKEMAFTAQGFPQLEVLQLSGLEKLEKLRIEEGGMPMLRALSIENCSQLTVPERLRSRTLPRQWEWRKD